MLENTKVEIQSSKKKIFLRLIGAIVFVALGIWVMTFPSDELTEIFYSSPTFSFIAKYGIGILTILFFSITAFSLTKKIFDNKPKLIMDEKGLTLYQIFISWDDIIRVENNSRYLIVFIKNPEQYIVQNTNKYKQAILRSCYKTKGSPVLVAVEWKQSLKQIEDLINSKRIQYKKK